MLCPMTPKKSALRSPKQVCTVADEAAGSVGLDGKLHAPRLSNLELHLYTTLVPTAASSLTYEVLASGSAGKFPGQIF